MLALLLVAASLTVANAKQGPRLVSTEINVAATVQRTAQRLLLRTDQAVSVLADQVTVAPVVPVKVSSAGSTVSVRFGQTLSYATTYEVGVGVRSTATGATATLRFVLRTPGAELYVLQRAGTGANTGPDDDIIRTVLGSSGREVVLRAPRIQGFAVAEPSLAIITQDGEDGGTLTAGPIDGSEPPRTIGQRAVFSQLRSSGPGGVFGFVRSPSDLDSDRDPQLELYNPATDELSTVKGLGGKVVTPQDWAFVPGTGSIVVHTEDSSLYLIDPASGAAPVPLGGHLRMLGFAGGTSTLILEDGEQYTMADLASGDTRTLPALDLRKDEALDALLIPPGNGGYLGLSVRLMDGDPRYSVVRIREGQPRPLYAPESSGAWIDEMCLSPNGEVLAVQVVPASAQTDGYMAAPGFKGMTTVVVDLKTGSSIEAIPGFGSNWCSAS